MREFRLLPQDMKTCDILPKNTEQAFALDMLKDDDLSLVSMIGKPGAGKTIIALAAGLHGVMETEKYTKILLLKPIVAMDNSHELGFLPGPQPLTAKLLTPNGWKTMGDIQKNDFVIGSDGKAKKVLEIYPKGEKITYRVEFSDGTSTECCDDHYWYTTTIKESQRKNGLGSVKSLKEIRETLRAYKTNLANHYIPLIKPVEFEKQNLIIPPYIMGVLLGDGTLSEKSSISFASADTEMFDNCKLYIEKPMICKIRSKNSRNNVINYSFIREENINNNQKKENLFSKEIERLGLYGSKSGTKYIPEIYKFSSIEDRLLILQGLMDTDGYVSKDGHDVSYSSTSKKLIEDVQFLVLSLGGYSNIKMKQSHYIKKGKKVILNSYVASITLPPEFCPFKLSRKIERFHPRANKLSKIISNITLVGSQETKCIKIESDDHLYATDYCILTHNTMEEKLGPWMASYGDNISVIMSKYAKEEDAPKRKKGKKETEVFSEKQAGKVDPIQELIAHGLLEFGSLEHARGRSLSGQYVILDECQNCSAHAVKTMITRMGEGSKIILMGDISQIDSPYLDSRSNGLSIVVDKFKEQNISGHVTLKKSERSKLAEIASELL